MKELIVLLERTNWTTVPVAQRSWRNDGYALDLTGTRQGPVGDFVYVNPHTSPASFLVPEDYARGVGLMAPRPSGTVIVRSLVRRVPLPEVSGWAEVVDNA